MVSESSDTASARPVAARRRNSIEFVIPIVVLVLAFLGLLLLWGFAQQLKLNTLKSFLAGTTQKEIESKYGPARFTSPPGRPLRESGWNGRDADAISESGFFVYNTSIFEFMVCEFDEQGRLKRATISPK